jgi:glycosyltransferase involved in cell wall biosynthesis
MKTLYFICPHNKFVTGGVKQIYRQVDILNKNNIKAYIVHKKKGQKADWLNNHSVKIINNRNIFKRLQSDKKANYIEKLKSIFYQKFLDFDISDGILVIPEIYGSNICNVNQEYIIYNQNCYYTFNNFKFNKNPYETALHLGTIINSFDGFNYLQNAFSLERLHKITLGIDINLFKYKKKEQRKIAYMPRKLSEDVNQVINILKLRNKINNWKFVEIDNLTEIEVANCLQDSAIFLSFSHKEGLGLPPMEAMSTGCVVVGYHGQGGEEFFKEDFTYTIDYCDIIKFVVSVERVCEMFDNKYSKFEYMSKMASEFINKNYNIEIEEQNTLQIYSKLLRH